MTSNLVVMPTDIMNRILLSFLVTGIEVLWHPFNFIASEKPLYRSVISAITTTTHALVYLVAPKELPICQAGIMAALIRVKEYIFRPATAFVRHSECCAREPRVWMFGASPANDLSSEEIVSALQGTH